MGRRLTRSHWAVVILCAPVTALGVLWIAAGAMTSGHAHPIWHLSPRNLSEAAAFRDGGAIVRRVWRGEDPSQPGEVQADFISNGPRTVTPLEAAVDNGRVEIVRLLLDLGARPDASSWRGMWCSGDAEAMRAQLARSRPDGASDTCEGQERPGN